MSLVLETAWLDDYLARVLGQPVTMLAFRALGGEVASDPKGFGYGVPFEVECLVGGERRCFVVSRTRPAQGFGHDTQPRVGREVLGRVELEDRGLGRDLREDRQAAHRGQVVGALNLRRQTLPQERCAEAEPEPEQESDEQRQLRARENRGGGKRGRVGHDEVDRVDLKLAVLVAVEQRLGDPGCGQLREARTAAARVDLHDRGALEGLDRGVAEVDADELPRGTNAGDEQVGLLEVGDSGEERLARDLERNRRARHHVPVQRRDL